MFLPLRLYSDMIIVQYTCLYEYGSSIGNAKAKSECETLGPLFASFNEAACDVYDGIFCPHPRSCTDLKACVEEQVDIANDDNLFAYKEYLNLAPKVGDADSSKECGALRQYLGYDSDFPDDSIICDEFVHIQCRSDFSNLDETIQGTSGGTTLPTGVLITTLTLKSTGES